MEFKFQTELGLVTVDDDVVVRVAGFAALDCYGIVGMASKRSTDGIVQLMGRENLGRGVRVKANGDKVDIDLYIIVEYGISISAVAASIIETVKYKVERLAGVPVSPRERLRGGHPRLTHAAEFSDGGIRYGKDADRFECAARDVRLGCGAF